MYTLLNKKNVNLGNNRHECRFNWFFHQIKIYNNLKVVKLFGKQSGLGRGFMKKKYVKKV